MQGRLRAFVLVLATLLGAIGFTVVGPASPAHADPVCQQGGAYVLFARGSGEGFDGKRAHQFQHYVMQALANEGVPSSWAELGNLDNDYTVQSGEYPAIRVDDWHSVEYANSLSVGVNELITHLNDRYAGNGPTGSGPCTRETLVLGGYSQGANVIGDALRSASLSQAAKDHIGYVALYGDPVFYPGPLYDRQYRVNFQSDWWWVRGDDAGFHKTKDSADYQAPISNQGLLGAAAPYAPIEFKGRFGSWCAAGDISCTLTGGWQIHDTAYDGYWIAQSADEVAYEAKLKRDQLDTGRNSALPLYLASAMPYGYVAWLPYMDIYFQTANYATPSPPIILQVKQSLSPDNTTHEVYAATNSTVTEGWWHSGGDGVHTDELINIAQDNIIGFDKVNEPDGVTQSLYTAVPDGVWETYWKSGGTGPQSAKIISGLSGVRQVIAAPTMINGQYTHRLYLLAEDGPHEVWWRDGGDGIHTSLLNNISGPVTMVKSTGPDGVDQLYVATPTWVYELWWWPGQGVHYSALVNITQGDIRSLAKDLFGTNGQLLYTGTSTSVWQSYWTPGSGLETHAAMSGQSNAIQVKKDNYNGVHELYLATGDHVQEYWWRDDGSNGTSTLITISQSNIASFDKSKDGNFQQIYTASGDLVYETYWAAGVGPTSNVLFKVAR